jgi:1,4-alpha-glucan branching enzyme
MHRRGHGVILDWVPSHFPSDDFALGRFDGTPLYEHADEKEGWHPDWRSYIFNYGRHEVRSFLISSAMSWIERYHVDGLRVDAVASMLYRDYSRNDGEWVPNIYGGRENLEAIEFLRQLNAAVGADHPDVITIAEESTAFPGVSRPVSSGGLGFHYKWDMGWMHDTLQFMERDPIHRRHHHDEITFRALYAFSEHYVLPLSHDEVTHGKGSILAKMPGDAWQQFANLRVLYANQWMNPGKKLLFMGQEFGQGPEWNHDLPVAWDQLEIPSHAGVAAWVRELNALYRSEPSLHNNEQQPASFEWLVRDDRDDSVLAWLRRGADEDRPVMVVLNLTPVPRPAYRITVPGDETWELLANSDAAVFGGSGAPVDERVTPVDGGVKGRSSTIELSIPPLACVVLAPVDSD